MKCYFARPYHLYRTAQDQRDIKLLELLGYEVVSPEFIEQNDYTERGMIVFDEMIAKCDCLAFRSVPDLRITAGVAYEIESALKLWLPVFELPTILESRKMSLTDTKDYLKLIGFK